MIRRVGWVGLSLLLALTAVSAFAVGQVYHRADWLPRWTDADGNCRDTRQEVLARDHRTGILEGETLNLEWSPDACRVLRGRWLEPYEGRGRVVIDPQDLDIDHVVPLGYAARHGGMGWPVERKRAYANWLEYRFALLGVSARANRAKGDRGPSEYVPDNVAFWCTYGTAWAVVVTVWKLDPPDGDREAIRKLVATC